jgi:coenzyme F420-0:L-glutamate ligase / coenzyme F420-1:gamma-L-glutamate ligase
VRTAQPARRTNKRTNTKHALPGLSEAQISKLLDRARVGRLATFGPKSGPHVVPVCFVYLGGFLYTAIDRKRKDLPPAKLARVRNIRAMPRVAFVIDHYEEDWNKLWFLLVRGTAKVLAGTSNSEHAAALRALRKKYAQYAAGVLSDDATLIRIAPRRVTFWKA